MCLGVGTGIVDEQTAKIPVGQKQSGGDLVCARPGKSGNKVWRTTVVLLQPSSPTQTTTTAKNFFEGFWRFFTRYFENQLALRMSSFPDV